MDNTSDKYKCLDLIICQASFKSSKPWSALLPSTETPKNVPMFPILDENKDSKISLPTSNEQLKPPIIPDQVVSTPTPQDKPAFSGDPTDSNIKNPGNNYGIGTPPPRAEPYVPVKIIN